MGEAFADPEIPDGERIVYRGSLDEEPVGIGEHRVQLFEEDGISFYRQSIVIRLSEEDVHYDVETIIRRRNGRIVTDSYRAETFDRGQRVSREEGSFRGVRGLSWGGEVQSFPADLAPLLGCAVSVRGMEWRKGEEKTFSLWLANTAHIEVGINVEKREELEVPAGTIDAWRVRAFPRTDRIAGRLHWIVERLLPPFRLHFAVDPPHPIVRFSFPTGPLPWHPRGLIEAEEIG